MIIDYQQGVRLVLQLGLDTGVNYIREDVKNLFTPLAGKIYHEMFGMYPEIFEHIHPNIAVYCLRNAATLEDLGEDIISKFLEYGLNVYAYPRREYVDIPREVLSYKERILEANIQYFDRRLLEALETFNADLWRDMFEAGKSGMDKLCFNMLLFAQLYEQAFGVLHMGENIEQNMLNAGYPQSMAYDEAQQLIRKSLGSIDLIEAVKETV